MNQTGIPANISGLGRDWDVVVLGAGPAGALAARELARRGIQVLLVDRQAFPRPKVCGACLNARVVQILSQAQLPDLLAGLQAVPLRRFRLAAGRHGVDVPLPGGVAVSRDAFDTALIGAARDAGAVFLPEATAELPAVEGPVAHREIRLRSSRSSAPEVTLRAKAVLAACGLGQPLLGQTGEFAESRATGARIGIGVRWPAEYPGIVPGTIYMAAGAAGYVGVVRVEDGSLNLAAALEPAKVKQAGSPAGAVASILQGTAWGDLELPAAGAWRGTLPLTRALQRVAGQRIFALGDAAGYVEPFTGEGIAWALESGQAIAPLVERGLAGAMANCEAAWVQMHRNLICRRQWWCRSFAAVLRHSNWAEWAIRLAAACPRICDPIVKSLNRPLRNQEVCQR